MRVIDENSKRKIFGSLAMAKYQRTQREKQQSLKLIEKARNVKVPIRNYEKHRKSLSQTSYRFRELRKASPG